MEKTQKIGESIGRFLSGGEIIELIGDVGAGKTTLVKGLAIGLGIDESIQSPSFTISRTYDARDGLQLIHYDFYRLVDAGIMQNELQEAMADSKNIIIIEWSDLVNDSLPSDRLRVVIKTTAEESRELSLESGGEISNRIIKDLVK